MRLIASLTYSAGSVQPAKTITRNKKRHPLSEMPPSKQRLVQFSDEQRPCCTAQSRESSQRWAVHLGATHHTAWPRHSLPSEKWSRPASLLHSLPHSRSSPHIPSSEVQRC